MRFDIYSHETDVQTDAMKLIEAVVFIEDYREMERLDEGKVGDTINTIKDKTIKLLKGLGLHVSTGKGLVHYLFTINKNILRLIYHGISLTDAAEHQREASRKAIQEIMGSVTKEEVLNFLYKLDALTLSVFTTPLKMLDAVTGWHIAGAVEKNIKPAIERAKQAIQWLESTKEHLTAKLKGQVQKYVNALRRVFNLGDFKKITT